MHATYYMVRSLYGNILWYRMMHSVWYCMVLVLGGTMRQCMLPHRVTERFGTPPTAVLCDSAAFCLYAEAAVQPLFPVAVPLMVAGRSDLCRSCCRCLGPAALSPVRAVAWQGCRHARATGIDGDAALLSLMSLSYPALARIRRDKRSRCCGVSLWTCQHASFPARI